METKLFVEYLRHYHGRPLKLMEVCGTHTAALYRSGLRNILPDRIQLLSGPGCPVCVTPTAYIDKLVSLSLAPDTCVLSFGDMLAVPGSRYSLLGARALGGNCDFFYQPEDVLERAAHSPQTQFVLAAVGFETTAPVWAALAQEILAEGLTNIKFLTALKTMPQVLEVLCRTTDIDGFLCPGHVAVITGSDSFRPLSERYHKPMVVAGFTPELLAAALSRLVAAAANKEAGLWNAYTSFVKPAGNVKAQALLKKVFQPGPASWRGLMVLPDSGLYLWGKYAALDAGSLHLDQDQVPTGCCCGAVLTGKITSRQCPLFGKACTPDHPVGACMVSNEGSCRIVYGEQQ
jgi:hydrogenase expression/formation protein HypD